jgi:uncharacterized membrane protein
MLFILPPLIAGLLSYFVAKARFDDYRAGIIFSGFSRYGTTLGIAFLIGLIIFACYIPYIAISATMIPAMMQNLMSGMPPSTAILSLILGVSLFCWALQMFFTFAFVMAFPIAMDDTNCGAIASLKRSRSMMSGKKWKFFCVFFRLFWWVFLVYIGMLALLAASTASGNGALKGLSLFGVIAIAIEYIRRIPIAFATYAHFYEDVRGLAEE